MGCWCTATGEGATITDAGRRSRAGGRVAYVDAPVHPRLVDADGYADVGSGISCATGRGRARNDEDNLRCMYRPGSTASVAPAERDLSDGIPSLRCLTCLYTCSGLVNPMPPRALISAISAMSACTSSNRKRDRTAVSCPQPPGQRPTSQLTQAGDEVKDAERGCAKVRRGEVRPPRPKVPLRETQYMQSPASATPVQSPALTGSQARAASAASNARSERRAWYVCRRGRPQ